MSLIDENFSWNPSSQPAVTFPSGADDYLDGGAGNDLLVGDGGMTFSLAEPVTIGCMVSRISSNVRRR